MNEKYNVKFIQVGDDEYDSDKTYDLEGLEHDELVNFIHREDHKRKVYRDAISHHLWGEKQSYDICLDSDLLSREKCAEILIEAASDCKLDLEECAQIIKSYFEMSCVECYVRLKSANRWKLAYEVGNAWRGCMHLWNSL